MNKQPVIVIDAGSSSVKAGFAGEDLPRAVFPAVTDPEILSNSKRAEYCDGSQDSTIHPIRRGIIHDWDNMERLLDHTFGAELEVHPETGGINGVPVLMTDVPHSSAESRGRMAQCMFEYFQAPALYMANSSVMSLFASGRTRGMVLECGGGYSSSVPIFEGFPIKYATCCANIGGQDITSHLHQMLARTEKYSKYELGHDVARDIKERHAVILVPSTRAIKSEEYALPDGVLIDIDAEVKFASSGSVIFESDLSGVAATEMPEDNGVLRGVSALVHQSMSMCDRNIQPDLQNSIVLAGGTTMIPGFLDRMKLELQGLEEDDSLVNFNVVPNSKVAERGYGTQRRLAAWVGASIFASLDTFQHVQVTKQEWDDYDRSAIHKKFI